MVEQKEEEGKNLFWNRELSWLEFNSRVLSQAEDKRVPLLERVNFLSIFHSNLDEFFMKRVGGLKRHLAIGVNQPSHDGMTHEEQLVAIREVVVPLLARAEKIYTEQLLPELKAVGVELLSWEELSEAERTFAKRYFREKVFPVLTPLAVDSGHPFPFISNLSTSLAVSLAHPETEELLFARVKVSDVKPRLLRLNPTTGARESLRFISVREIILNNLDDLFPNMNVRACMPFRVTRNSDLEVDEEEAECLLELIEEELRQRRFAKVVRLEHGRDADQWILDFLLEELDLYPDDVFQYQSEIDWSFLGEIAQLQIQEHRFPTWNPVTPTALPEDTKMFTVLRSRDVLVHHPFESFSQSVERFVREAAEDPRVLSIKMTVYRVGDETPLIPLLMKAAQSGKQVICLVELKARFEEERNIQWAQKLEDAGVHVVYGIPGLKIHAKTLLIVREEPEGVRCYGHVGTGNYHVKTANLYTDLGIFTAKASYTDEMLHFFNYLTGRSMKEDYEKLLVSPINMEPRFLEMIDREIQNKRAGKPARVIAKMNSLEDRHMIQKLYEASAAGVQVDLLVRGLCCLRAGIPGLSENIRVVSIVGRLLEHSRVYFFQNGQTDELNSEYFIGSADWMGRNLHRRVEVIAPIEERADRQVCWEMFQIMLNDHRQAWEMQPDGTYLQLRGEGSERDGTHELLMRLTREQVTQ